MKKFIEDELAKRLGKKSNAPEDAAELARRRQQQQVRVV